MLSMKWKEDRENHLVSLWQETGKRGRARRDGKRKSGLKHLRPAGNSFAAVVSYNPDAPRLDNVCLY